MIGAGPALEGSTTLTIDQKPQVHAQPLTHEIFTITPGAPEPIHRQLVDQLRRRVERGHVVAGQALPSAADLARSLVVHPETIVKGLDLMVEAGLLVRSGDQLLIASVAGPGQTTG